MLPKLKAFSPSDWTLFVFGILAFFLGLLGLINPNLTLLQLGFTTVEQTQRTSFDYTLVFITTSSMASFNIGVYYVLAAFSKLRKFYSWTVPFRCVTFVVFTLAVVRGLAPARFMVVPVWELTGAVATGLALWYEKQRGMV